MTAVLKIILKYLAFPIISVSLVMSVYLVIIGFMKSNILLILIATFFFTLGFELLVKICLDFL